MSAFSGRLDRAARLALPAGAAAAEYEGCAVLFDGHLSNLAELRRRFGAGSEEEAVAHAFRAWGRELEAHVLGEFSAVVVDRAAGRALLAHDSLGMRPLFYSRRDGGLAFATRLADLVDGSAAEEIDDEYLADFLALGGHTGERTPYRAIRRLLPGRGLWWSAGRLEQLDGWSLAEVEPPPPRDGAAYAGEFRELLAEAVGGALPRDGVAWTDLSGGLDSSSVTGMAALLGAPGLAACSIVQPGLADADEQPWMRAVVEHHGLPWHRLDIESMLPFTRPPLPFLGEPDLAVMEGAQMEAKRELFAAHGVTTRLTGYGGDLSLGQYGGSVPAHLADPLFRGRPLATLREVRAWRNGSAGDRSYTYWLLRGVAQPALDHLRGRSRMRGAEIPVQPWIRPEYVDAARFDRRSASRYAPRCREPGRQWIADRLWTSALAMGPVSQRDAPYDVRSPLLDRRLVEFMCTIEPGQRMRPARDRYLQREALRGVLPELVRNRRTKRVGSRAFVEGLRRSGDWLEFLTDECLMAERGIADAERWRLAVRQAMVGQTNGDQFFQAGVAIEAWLKQLRDRRRVSQCAIHDDRFVRL